MKSPCTGVCQHPNRILAAILALSVVIRVLVALYLGDVVDAPPLLTDQRSYHALGARLVAGHGYTFAEHWYPFTPAGTPTAHWSFLYPLFVAAVYALFGVHPLAARLVQAVLGGVLLPWAVYRLARSTFERTEDRTGEQLENRTGGRPSAPTLGLLAAGIAALYPYFILYAATLMTETFYLVAVLISMERGLALAARLRDGAGGRAGTPAPLWPAALGLGLSLGIAALLRQSILPWVPVLLLYLLWEGGRGQRWGPAFGAAIVTGSILVACIMPWTVRNYHVYGDFLLLNSNTGYAMYSAQHPMHGVRFREYDAAPLPEGWWGRPEPALDRALMGEAIDFVRQEPGRYLLLSLSRVRAYFEFWPTPGTTLLHNVGRTGSFGLLLPPLLWGLILALREPGFLRRNALLLVFGAVYTLLHLLTWAMVRYRLPVDAAWMPFAAWGLSDLARKVDPKGVRCLIGRKPLASGAIDERNR